MNTLGLLGAACAAAVAGLVLAEQRGWPRTRAACKLAASSAFVAAALGVGAADWPTGRWLLAALLLGWVGDALLLSQRNAAFLGGLGAFLVSHLCFAAGFVAPGTAPGAAALALLPALAAGAVIGRWLWPHLPPADRAPVLAYLVTILAMCVAAASYASLSGSALALLAAVLFAASDVAVARDRFVQRAFVNRAWGLPVYYAAQWLMAMLAAPAR